jgi:hypothetical protein
MMVGLTVVTKAASEYPLESGLSELDEISPQRALLINSSHILLTFLFSFKA